MADTEKIVKKLNEGRVGIFPTDTAYGMGCRMNDIDAVKRVFVLRKRPDEKALIVLVSSIEMAERYVEIPKNVREGLVDKYWPGGLSIILKCRLDMVPGIVRANGETLAVRFPDKKDLVEIIEKVGVPIVAPSANYSGEKTPFSLFDVDLDLCSKVDFVASGMCTIKGVSTIIDTTVAPWKIVRQGVVRIEI